MQEGALDEREERAAVIVMVTACCDFSSDFSHTLRVDRQTSSHFLKPNVQENQNIVETV